jgi:hypothetical protein
MKKLKGMLLALIACMMVVPAWADHVRFGVVVGGPFWGPPPYYYNPPVYYHYSPPIIVNQPAPVYVEQAPAAEPQAAANWYYCQKPKGYYPYVKKCPSGWQQVPATPADDNGVPPQ